MEMITAVYNLFCFISVSPVKLKNISGKKTTQERAYFILHEYFASLTQEIGPYIKMLEIRMIQIL